MADHNTCLPLSPESIAHTYGRIKPYIHRTPLITSRTLNEIASSPNPSLYVSDDPPGIWNDDASFASACHANSTGDALSPPRFNLYFKLESTQKIGAFKARGAFSALTHLASPQSSRLSGIGIDRLRARGVITHSSGNHAQALALAASTLGVKAWIVMPEISTKSKISGTKGFRGVEVVFSGSTSTEREAVVERVIQEQEQVSGKGNGPILVPPYDHPDIILGQGTAGMEMEAQFQALQRAERERRKAACSGAVEQGRRSGDGDGDGGLFDSGVDVQGERFDAVLTPLGGGGLLSGTATWFSHTHADSQADAKQSTYGTSIAGKAKKTLIFGCEPSHQGANDGERGLAASPPKRIEHVKTLTIADGLRTPVGILPWSIISNPENVQAAFSVTEVEIKMALKLIMERVKIVIEPSSAVPIAVILFNKKFRQLVAERQQDEGTQRAWDVGVVISGGNTTVEALSKVFEEGWMSEVPEGKEESRNGQGAPERERETGKVGMYGTRTVEDVAG